jgi:kumamolisin
MLKQEVQFGNSHHSPENQERKFRSNPQGEIVIRRLSVFLSVIVAFMSGATLVSQAQPQALLTRHVRDVIVSGHAQSVGHLPATRSLRLEIVLPVRDQAGFDSFLHDVYDPLSPFYRHYVTPQEFTARFGPSQQDYDAVIHFAMANGFTVVGGSRDALTVSVRGTVANVEAAFHVTMGLYQHPTENRTFYAPDREPTVDLPFQLWEIAGLDNYSTPHPALQRRNSNATSKATTGSCPETSFCGSDMRAAYYGGTALTGTGQNIGLLEFVGFDIADVNTYYKNAKQTRTATVTGISTDGTSINCTAAQGCDDTEQTLDITQALGMAPGVGTVFVYVGSTPAALLGGMSTDKPLPLNLSSSWTWTPADPKGDDPFFLKMQAQGQSYFQAAGDSGNWKTSTYPSEDTNVTTVGGTDLTTSGAGGPWATESTWVDGGGGFYAPDKILIPPYQQLAGVITSANKGSTTYRNGPDVAANSNFTFYVCADQSGCTANEFGGTSFAAPMFAGYLALANQQAATNGDAPPGFINPAIYPLSLGAGYGAAFHDIISGSNGFPAVTGYDLATGWGSPNGAGLINALVGSVSSPSFTISASPTAVSVVQGSSGTSTITTAISGGFDAAVALSATGQPTGVTVTFNPTSIPAPGAGTSVMTMAVASTTTPGNYPITVTGIGGGVTQTTTVTLTVTASATGKFAISASPNALTIARGSSGTSTITAKIGNGFDSAITLSAGGGTSFSPNPIPAPGSGTSTMTITVGKSIPLGAHTLTVKGAGGGQSHTTTIQVTVTQ